MPYRLTTKPDLYNVDGIGEGRNDTRAPDSGHAAVASMVGACKGGRGLKSPIQCELTSPRPCVLDFL